MKGNNELLHLLLNILKHVKELFCSDEYIKNPNFVSRQELIKKSDIIILGVPHKKYSKLKISKSKYVYDMWDFLK